jgi:hypothetical protein
MIRLLGAIKHDGTNIVHLCDYKVNVTVEQSGLLNIVSRLSITNCITVNQFYGYIKCRDNAVRLRY